MTKLFPVKQVLKHMKIVGIAKSVTWRQPTTYTKDELGSDTGTEDDAVINTTITAYIEDKTTEESDLFEKGFSQVGDAVAYIDYGTVDASDNPIKTKDFIIDTNVTPNITWVIEEIKDVSGYYTMLNLRRYE